MARKGQRIKVGLQCTVCKRVNYITQRNKQNTQDALKLEKYCQQCKKHIAHKERKKLD